MAWRCIKRYANGGESVLILACSMYVYPSRALWPEKTRKRGGLTRLNASAVSPKSEDPDHAGSGLDYGKTVTESNYLLSLYQRAQKWPLGGWIFARIFAAKAPYFGSISPRVTVLRPYFCEVCFGKRRKVENHIHTVHVIAICNAL